MKSDNVLELWNIRKEFSGVEVLHGIDLCVRRGCVHSLVGENGAGKSTLMKILSGFYPYGEYSGELVIDGQAVRFSDIRMAEEAGIEIISQELELVGQLTVFENIFLGKELVKNREYLEVDNKVFIRGRVSEEDAAASRLICEAVIPFGQTKRELWLQFESKVDFQTRERELYGILNESEGVDEIVIYCKAERAVKRLGANRNVCADAGLLSRLTNYLGESCVKLIEKSIENK